jgi:hypothetical protein
MDRRRQDQGVWCCPLIRTQGRPDERAAKSKPYPVSRRSVGVLGTRSMRLGLLWRRFWQQGPACKRHMDSRVEESSCWHRDPPVSRTVRFLRQKSAPASGPRTAVSPSGACGPGFRRIGPGGGLGAGPMSENQAHEQVRSYLFFFFFLFIPN